MLLTAASQARVTCPRGPTSRSNLTGREGIPDDGILTEPGILREPPLWRGFSLAEWRGPIVRGDALAAGEVEREVGPARARHARLARRRKEHRDLS